MNHVLTPLDQFYHWEKTTPGNNFFRQPHNGRWYTHTYREAGNEIRRIAGALRALNLAPGSNIAILSKNCAHWIMADLAIWMAGHVSVPVYPTLSADGVRYILEHSESKVIFLGKLDSFEKQKSGIPDSIHRISFPYYGPAEGTAWDDMLRHDAEQNNYSPALTEVASILYSSGTTGKPKGVLLSFGAFDFVGKSMVTDFHINRPEQFISYLPLSHIAEKAYLGMGALYSGSSVAFIESLDKFAENLRTVQPTIFGGVPRIFTKFQEGILAKMPQKKLDTLLSIPLLGGFIRRTIVKKLGFNRVHLIVAGAAAFPVELLEWFARLGVIIREVYGMTENCGYSFGDHGKTPKFGTVGKAWSSIQAKLTEEGEILTKHRGLMMGYYKDPEGTANAFTADRFLKTGDVGTLDTEGYLTITGRIKDQFKTDKGKFIAPTPIELKLVTNKDIEHACVVGTGIPQPIALIVLSTTGRSKSKEEIAASILATINSINPTLEHYERIEKGVILNEDWTIENGYMTPSLKLKRNEIEKTHMKNYTVWYKEKDKIIRTASSEFVEN